MNNSLTADEDQYCSYNHILKVVISVVISLTAFSSLVENTVLCYIIYNNRKLHKRPLVLITNLAVIDGILALVMAPLEIIQVLEYPNWSLKNTGTYFFNAIWMFSLVAPFTTVTAIGIERYLAVRKDMIYQRVVNSKSLVITILSIWTYSISWIMILSLTSDSLAGLNNTYVWNIKQWLYNVFLGTNVGIPLILITFLYQKIIKEVRASKAAIRKSFSKSLSTSREVSPDITKKSYEGKLSKTVGYVILLLFIIWAPILGVEIFYAYDDACWMLFGDISIWLVFLSGCFNPFIYSFRNKEIKKSFKELMANLRCNFKSYNVQNAIV